MENLSALQTEYDDLESQLPYDVSNDMSSDEAAQLTAIRSELRSADEYALLVESPDGKNRRFQKRKIETPKLLKQKRERMKQVKVEIDALRAQLVEHKIEYKGALPSDERRTHKYVADCKKFQQMLDDDDANDRENCDDANKDEEVVVPKKRNRTSV